MRAERGKTLLFLNAVGLYGSSGSSGSSDNICSLHSHVAYPSNSILKFFHKFDADDENAHRLSLLRALCDPQGPSETCEKALTDIEVKMRLKTGSFGCAKGNNMGLAMERYSSSRNN
jgi:hypothetical protein